MPIDQPPPAITAENTAPAYDPTSLSSVMQEVARLTPTTDKAREFLNQISSEDGKGLWRAIWGIEICNRIIELRKRSPNAVIPPELEPLEQRIRF
jgi:hypothetical protein